MISIVFCIFILVAKYTVSSAKSKSKDVISASQTAFDCAMRKLLMEYAVQIQPNITSDQLQDIADALNGTPGRESNCTIFPNSSMLARPARHAPCWDDLKKYEQESYHEEHPFIEELNELTLFVSGDNGDDSNIGTLEHPLRSLQVAIEKARGYDINTRKRIVLRGGKYYIKDTIRFGSNDANYLITNFNNEQVILSGASPLDCNWKFYQNGTNGKDIYQCDLSSANIGEIKGLRINGLRAIRARYPNANPERDGFGSTLTASSWNPPTLPAEPDEWYYPDFPLRNDSSGKQYIRYSLGIGGACNNFDPPAGYWCSLETHGGGANTYTIPSGMKFNQSVLPNSPYNNASQAVIQSWRPAHWASWMFAVGTYDKSDVKNQEFVFSKGGFQGARGSSAGEEFYIENVLEEVDYPTEWFYNKTSKMLYYYNNDTNGAPNGVTFEATNLKVLINYDGSMDKPVENHVVRGMTFQDTKYTYLDPHGMPSGGDWGLQRTGAVYLNYVSNIIIENNNFTRLDGNALSINRYARNVSVISNEFSWIGDSAITQWGDTEDISFQNLNNTDTTTMGYDGTNGNQPRGTYIGYNFVHELGIWEKQSSFYFQAKSCSNLIENNIFFNGPRAGVNFNDGFGGGSKLLKNILFNTCRESSDHGNFNSWDRQVYYTKVASNGETASTIKEYDEIGFNFMIGNYDVTQVIDNDDGSCYYKTYNNLLAYSSNGQKADYGGHDNHHYNNIYAYLRYSSCFALQEGYDTWTLSGHNNWYFNNTCIIGNTIKELSTYGTFNCTQTQDTWPILGNNSIYVANGTSKNVGLCGKSEDVFQSMYRADLGTKIYDTYPSTDQLVSKIKTILSM